jgi:hypothetical protein
MKVWLLKTNKLKLANYKSTTEAVYALHARYRLVKLKDNTIIKIGDEKF